MTRRGRGNRVRLADLGPEAQEQARQQLQAWRERDREPAPGSPDPGPPDPLEGASALERRYALHLQDEQAAGRVLWCRFEPIRLVLRPGKKGAKGLTYTPDFLVLLAGGQVELHEVKPTKDDKVFWMGDSRTKVLSAAEIFRPVPWKLVLVWPTPGGWSRSVL